MYVGADMDRLIEAVTPLWVQIGCCQSTHQSWTPLKPGNLLTAHSSFLFLPLVRPPFHLCLSSIFSLRVFFLIILPSSHSLNVLYLLKSFYDLSRNVILCNPYHPFPPPLPPPENDLFLFNTLLGTVYKSFTTIFVYTYSKCVYLSVCVCVCVREVCISSSGISGEKRTQEVWWSLNVLWITVFLHTQSCTEHIDTHTYTHICSVGEVRPQAERFYQCSGIVTFVSSVQRTELSPPHILSTSLSLSLSISLPSPCHPFPFLCLHLYFAVS